MIFFCWVDSASVADSNSLGASIHVRPSCSGRVNGFGHGFSFVPQSICERKHETTNWPNCCFQFYSYVWWHQQQVIYFYFSSEQWAKRGRTRFSLGKYRGLEWKSRGLDDPFKEGLAGLLSILSIRLHHVKDMVGIVCQKLLKRGRSTNVHHRCSLIR